MKKALIIIVVLAVIGGGAWFFMMKDPNENPTNNTPTTPSSPTPSQVEEDEEQEEEANEVYIENFSFKPATITVKKGTKVTWTNKDSVGHTVTPDESASFTGSELLNKDASYSVTFDTVGTFAYHCQPHPQMTAKVVVTE